MSALLRVVVGVLLFGAASVGVAQEEESFGDPFADAPRGRVSTGMEGGYGGEMGMRGYGGEMTAEEGYGRGGRAARRRAEEEPRGQEADRPKAPEVTQYWVDGDPKKTEYLVKMLRDRYLTEAGIDFVDTPLEEVVSYLRDEYDIEIHLDVTALDDFGLAPDEPISCNLRHIKLGAALRLMLQPLELTYFVHDGVLVITTEDTSLNSLQFAVYPVADLLGPELNDYASLIEAIVSNIQTDTWARNGGGEAEIRAFPARGALVISQTYATHEEIAGLLVALRKCDPCNAPAPRSRGGMGGRGMYGGATRGGGGEGGGMFSIPPAAHND